MTHHITNVQIHKNKHLSDINIHTARNSMLTATAEVDLRGKLNSDDFVVKNALFEANSPYHLLGVCLLVKNGNSVHFYEHSACIQDPNGQMILEASVMNDM